MDKIKDKVEEILLSTKRPYVINICEVHSHKEFRACGGVQGTYLDVVRLIASLQLQAAQTFKCPVETIMIDTVTKVYSLREIGNN